jgi:hypothetical protein
MVRLRLQRSQQSKRIILDKRVGMYATKQQREPSETYLR